MAYYVKSKSYSSYFYRDDAPKIEYKVFIENGPFYDWDAVEDYVCKLSENDEVEVIERD